jgi:hypothetical protein
MEAWMAAKTELKLDEAHAEAIVELGIKYGAYSEEMPDSKKDKIAAAEEIIAFTIDAWVNDDIRPDDDNAKVAKSGEQIAEIHELAGIEIDDDDEVIYGELPDLDGEDDDDNGDDDETAFDPDDYIDGYSEMSVSAKVKAVKALDADDDDDVATMEALVEWENEQDKPSARVLNLIEEAIGEPEDDDEPEADDEDESAEPWEGYDKSSAVEIKKILTAQMADEDDPLTVEQVQYVLDYEQNREKPPPRKRVITFCEELIEQLNDEGASEPDDDDDDEPKGIAGARRGRGKKKSAAKVAEDNGLVIELTREQILTALDSGTVSIEVA